MINCLNHPDKEIAWVCLEKNCALRIMCNICAVKVHERHHKVEEFESIR
jgi:ferredoxin